MTLKKVGGVFAKCGGYSKKNLAHFARKNAPPHVQNRGDAHGYE